MKKFNTYLNMVERGGVVRVVQGHGDIPESESDTEIAVLDAILAANRYNVGYYHPDVYVSTPDHYQVISGNNVVGFIAHTEVET